MYGKPPVRLYVPEITVEDALVAVQVAAATPSKTWALEVPRDAAPVLVVHEPTPVWNDWSVSPRMLPGSAPIAFVTVHASQE
jgi:hypothetical protein